MVFIGSMLRMMFDSCSASVCRYNETEGFSLQWLLDFISGVENSFLIQLKMRSRRYGMGECENVVAEDCRLVNLHFNYFLKAF
ncbi:hypothetical protein ACHQM5_002448 [Ranunculus cassubicifolius]